MESGTFSCPAPDELNLDATLRSGQVFRWRQEANGTWRGHTGERLLTLRIDNDTLHWSGTGPEPEQAVRRFLRLEDLSLAPQAKRWAALDPLFREAWSQQRGVRLLHQDPHECFFSFLCASVAPIARISKMLQAVTEEATGDPFGPFPNLDALLTLREDRLRLRGLGFRAERVVSAARLLAQKPDNWLATLRDTPLAEVEQALMEFPGIGRKIADCIALFSLDADSAIPVDTHIWRIARTHYLPELQDASLTPAHYEQVVGAFQRRFGPHAGWAQQILFYRQAVGER